MTAEANSARNIALVALADRAGNVSARLKRLLAAKGLSAVEAALARELALGVVRRRGTLSAVVDAFRSQKRDMPGRLWSVLQIGVYQLLFLDRVPAFAAIDEAVKQARRGGKPVTGFVNGLLRNVARSVGEPTTDGSPAVDCLPVGPGLWRRFDRPVFPDPVTDATGYLAAAGSLPTTLAASWLRLFDGLAGALPMTIHASARPPLIVRVNSARANLAEVLAELQSAGVDAQPHANGLSIVLAGHVKLTRLRSFTEGKVLVQDPSATAVVAGIDVEPGMRVLDLCAAPGTKTMHLAEKMANRGEIVAVDVSAEKLIRIDENCRRLGVDIVRPILAGDVSGLEEGSFDVVLVDAPCSNTGVLARRPEARWRFDDALVAGLARDQRNLLNLGLGFARAGGRCVYSTCSLQREEDEMLVSALASGGADKKKFMPRRTAPAGADDAKTWSDGGFSAVCAV